MGLSIGSRARVGSDGTIDPAAGQTMGGLGAVAGRADRARDALLRRGAAQRVRVGLTGLAAIFLVVLIAAAGLKPARSLAPSGAPGEPLAVLGVAPGAGSAPAAAPATTPPRPSRG